MSSEISRIKDGLLKNVLIIAAGTLGSRLLTFVLPVLFSYYIYPAEMGFFDMVMVTSELIMPVATLQLTNSTYRWLVVEENEKNRKIIVSTNFLVFSCAIMLTVCSYMIGTSFFFLKYPFLISLYFMTACLHSFCLVFVRGMKQNRLYALSDLLRAIMLVLMSWILLSVFRFGIKGVLIAYIVAGTTSIVWVIFSLRAWRYVSLKAFSKKLLFEFMSYSLPFIPSSMGWWLINSANRYIILLFLGTESNGIYAISNRFATVVYILYSVFYLAWQESAFREFNTKHRDQLYSDIFARYFNLSTAAVIALIPFCKIFILYFLGKEYVDSWRYLPVLLVGVLFATFSSFFSTGYAGAKKTSGLMYSVTFGAVVNIATSWLLIPRIGLQGAPIGTVVGFLTTTLLQIWQTRKFFKIQTDIKNVARGMAGVALSVCLAFVVEGLYGLVVFAAASLAFFLYSNRSLLKIALLKIKK